MNLKQPLTHRTAMSNEKLAAIRAAIHDARSDAADYGSVFSHGNDQRALLRARPGSQYPAYFIAYTETYRDEMYARFAHATPEAVAAAEATYFENRTNHLGGRSWLRRELASYVKPVGRQARLNITGVAPGETCSDCGMLVSRA